MVDFRLKCSCGSGIVIFEKQRFRDAEYEGVFAGSGKAEDLMTKNVSSVPEAV